MAATDSGHSTGKERREKRKAERIKKPGVFAPASIAMKKQIDLVVFLILAAFLIIALIISCRKDFNEVKVSEQIRTAINEIWVKDEVLVKFKANETNIIKLHGFAVKEKVLTKAMERDGDPGFFVLKVPDVSNAIEALRNNPNVTYVQPNYIIRTNQTYPNDPYFNDLWGIKNIKADVAWATNKGSQKIYAGVVDEGVMYCHEDLKGQIWYNPYDTLDGVDNDGNGYVDDIHGWDFMHNDNSVWDGVGKDQHGTHVSGTIGGKGNNATGVIGVSPEVTIIPAKFLEQIGATSDAVKAWDYITDLKIRHGMNVAATSNSWGYGGEESPVLGEAIRRAKAADILVICAAGNNYSDNDVSPFWPANYSKTEDNVLSIGALDEAENRASFSNIGATTVDLFAPGVNILSTVQNNGYSGYASFSGTSMATPHVTGGVCLYAAGHPTANYLQKKNAITGNVRVLPQLAGKCKTGGTLDVSSFIQGSTDIPVERDYPCELPCVSVPAKVLNVMQTGATNTSITIKWSPSSVSATATNNTPAPSFLLPGVFENKGFKIEYGTVQNRKQITTSASVAPQAAGPDSCGVWFYGVQIKQAGFGDILTSTYDTAITVAGLPPGTDFTVIIYAISYANVYSSPSDPVTASTTGTPDTEPPTVPSYLKPISSTSTSFHFGWGPATDNVGVYAYYAEWGDTLVGAREHWYGGANIYGNVIYDIDVPNHPPDRLWHINIRAYDRAGNYGPWTDTIWMKTVDSTYGEPPPPIDTEPPTVNINSPADGTTLPQRGNKNVTISISASDNVGVTGTQILIDGVLKSTSLNYTWNTNKVSRGSHTITARAKDAAGNTGTKTITVFK